MNKQIIAIVVVVIALVGYVVWQNRQSDTPEIEVNPPDQAASQLQSQVDDFLNERGITLPEGSQRANLEDKTQGASTGVATSREVQTGERSITILASLPDIQEGWYQAWLRTDDGYHNLGQLRQAKGGYLLDDTMVSKLGNTIVVSQETKTVTQPSTIILEGAFE